ncbi:BTAD domain-containing putative transcriptional regulator [Actinoplanes solisilvae]|uniref:BTAD domain-containing putative transcriptional regulator n=1 Tax=Actinoplanes solisilvae TaxID=2486853 RepID=UPI0013E31A81|nr:BTAD domain-containing putative transcriptional regulator [Actinoplanes solisilvae]
MSQQAERVLGPGVGLLGPVVLTVDGEPVALAGARQRALLAALTAAAGAAVPADRLAEAMWSDTGQPAARSTLHVHVHQLRRTLGPQAAALQYGPAGYRLVAASDVQAVEDGLRRARAADQTGDVAGAAAGYRSALARWRGEFCADLPDHDHFHAARTVYETIRLDAMEAVLAAELRLGMPGLVPELEDLVLRHPLRERFWGHLMVALYRDGRQADALAAFRRAREVLAAELGLDPGSALRELERAILGQAATSQVLRVVAPQPIAAGRPVLTWLDAAGAVRRRELPRTGELLIGRAEAADVSLSGDAAVSRRHAAVRVAGGGDVTVADLGSRNGTFLNGAKLGPSDGTQVRSGDILRCGDTVLAFTTPARKEAVASDGLLLPTRTDAGTPMANVARGSAADPQTPAALGRNDHE